VANRDDLSIETELGDMRDLSRFENEYFDLILHPASNAFVDNVLPIYMFWTLFRRSNTRSN